MNWKLHIPSRVANVVVALVGLGLLVTLAFSLNALLGSRSQQSLRTASQPDLTPHPTRSSPPMEELGALLTDAIRMSVEKALSSPTPVGYHSIPEGTRLLDLRVTGRKAVIEIEINLSKEILDKGSGVELEDALHIIATSIGNEIPDQFEETRFTFLIEGKPLSEYP